MKTLKCTTDAGVFSRTTAADYRFVVVRKASKKESEYEHIDGGVWYQCRKQNGHHVTWHTTRALADKAASKPYGYDWNSSLVGVFQVDGGPQ